MKIDFTSFKLHYTRPLPHQFPTGSRVYKGFQGSGKTLSMVHDTFDLADEFPNCHIFSNVLIRDLNNFHFIQSDSDVLDALRFSNGSNGVLILLDEAHLFFNKKSGISLDVLTAISQQRKDRRKIFMSSQIWEDLDVSLRKQVKEVVNCRTLFKKFQFNRFSDGESIRYDNLHNTWVANPLYTVIFKHNDFLYGSYDTYQKIISNQDYAREFSISNGLPQSKLLVENSNQQKNRKSLLRFH